MRIKEILKRKGLTAKEVAVESGITEAILSNVANGKGNPSLQTLTKIADALGVEVRDLFDGAPLVELMNCPKCGAEIRVAITHVKISAMDERESKDTNTEHQSDI